jgi:hypothetical protein
MMCRWHQLNLSFCTKYILGQCMANSLLRFGRKKNRCIIASQPKAMHRCTTSTSCCLCRMSGTEHIPCHVKVQEKTLEVQINIYQGSAWRQEAYLARTSFFFVSSRSQQLYSLRQSIIVLIQFHCSGDI